MTLILALLLLAMPGCRETVPDDVEPPPDDDSPAPTARLQPQGLVYQGAFRLPAGSNGCDWSWSGEALANVPAAAQRRARLVVEPLRGGHPFL